MTESTKEYEYLKVRISELKVSFNFEQADGEMTKPQEDQLKGFQLLCHAELEDYFESIALRIFDESVAKWRSERNANYQLASYFIEQDRLALSADSFTKSMQLVNQYNQNIIKKNHGIKEQNIKKMYEPLGYSIDDFDSVLLSELNSFGSQRGESAHKSKKHTQTQLDKNNVYSEVDRIVELISGFEEVIRSRFFQL